MHKEHSGTSNPQPSSKAEDETDRCGAICNKQHNDVVELEQAQRLSSTLGLPCQLMCTFWPAFVPQGHKDLTRILCSSSTPLFPKIITDKCLFRLQHLAMRPSMPFRKQPRSRCLLRNTPSTVWTRPVKSLRATPTNLNFLGPNQKRLAQHGISQNQSF